MAKPKAFKDGAPVRFETQDGKQSGTVTQRLNEDTYLVMVTEGSNKGQTIGVAAEALEADGDGE